MKILASTSRGHIVLKSTVECLRLFGIRRVRTLMNHIECGNPVHWCGLRVYLDVLTEPTDKESELTEDELKLFIRNKYKYKRNPKLEEIKLSDFLEFLMTKVQENSGCNEK